jgi:hypothetical protein
MMSSSLFKLRAESNDPLAILEIATGSYELIVQGPGPVTCQVVPGLYIVRAKYLDRVEEKLIRLVQEDKTVRFESQLTPSEKAARDTGVDLVVRVTESQRGLVTHWISIAIKPAAAPRSESLSIPPVRVSDFQICRLDGTPIESFRAGTAETPPIDPDAIGEAASLELETGWYTLSMPGGGGARTLLPLYLAPRFSPTVFLEARSNRDEQWIDYDRLLISYDAREVNSLSDPLRLYAIEMARRSLELGRNALTKPLMDVLLQQKFQDPTLGLLAMQLLLLSARSKERQVEGMFNTVARNMANAFGTAAHPDLVLAREHARRKGWRVPTAEGDKAPLVAPPLLRSNWNAMLDLPPRRKELATRTSQLNEVGQSLIRAGVWVVWKPSLRAATRPPNRVPVEVLESSEVQFRESILSSKRALPPVARPLRRSRKPDDQLEESVDLVRAHAYLQEALKDGLAANPAMGTVLDRTVARTVLQLAGFEFGNEQNVPTGYAKQMANSLTLPLPLVKDSIARVRTALAKRASLGELPDVAVRRIELDLD